METLQERLKLVQQEKSKSVRNFAELIGCKQPTVDNQLRGTRQVSIDVITAVIITFEDISAEWLLTGKGSMTKESAKNINIFTDSKVATNGSSIDSHNSNADLLKENEELRAEVKQLRERCDKLTDKLLAL